MTTFLPQPESAESAAVDRSFPNSSWLTLFLEDDHDLWRKLVGSFGAGRTSPAVSQRIGFGITLAVFLVVFGLLMQVMESQQASATNKEPVDQELGLTSWSPDAQRPDSPGQQPEAAPPAGPKVYDQNFTFGSIAAAASERADAASKAPPIGSLANNNRASVAGGVTGSGFGGGAPPPRANDGAGSEQAPIQVPETGSSGLLLALALSTVLGLSLLVRRRLASPSGYR